MRAMSSPCISRNTKILSMRESTSGANPASPSADLHAVELFLGTLCSRAILPMRRAAALVVRMKIVSLVAILALSLTSVTKPLAQPLGTVAQNSSIVDH